jgi:hypothetical protein
MDKVQSGDLKWQPAILMTTLMQTKLSVCINTLDSPPFDTAQ